MGRTIAYEYRLAKCPAPTHCSAMTGKCENVYYYWFIVTVTFAGSNQ